jgi:hypothetical protein
MNAVKPLRNTACALLCIAAAWPAAQAAEDARCPGSCAPGAAPSAAGPYPVAAAGWGPELGQGLMASRWAEDWHALRAAGRAPAYKARALGAATLTLSAETRLRLDSFHHAQLQAGKHYEQALLRAIAGAELRLGSRLRLYGELGTAQVAGQRRSATPNFQNALSLQQGLVDARGELGGALVGILAGRQEFGDGPRQLISLSDGPNLHRSWNGVRLYAQRKRWRLGAFDLRATRLQRGGMDEQVNAGERLRGLTGSLIVSSGGPHSFLDPFWYRTDHPAFRLGGRSGRDERDTLGLRFWGRQGALRYDWTAARQHGRSLQHPVRAFGLFTVHSYELSGSAWKPRLTARLDLASGGGSQGAGPVRAFNPLYASSNYLGEGQFLGLSNLLMATPGLTLAPAPGVTVSLDYGMARRRREGEPVYAGGMRAYAGTANLPGKAVGGLGRVMASWSAGPRTTLALNYERLRPAPLLQGTGRKGGHYLYTSLSYRY